MKKIQHINTVAEYNAVAQHKTLHPLVSIIDFSKVKHTGETKHTKPDIQVLSFGFYAVFLKESKHCNIRYGRNIYDYQEGTLIFIAPDQITSIEEDEEDYQPDGYALLFHPELLRGTSLAHTIKDYTFFSYAIHEALHLAGDEKQIVIDCLKKIAYEIERAIDKHSKKLIVANIELFLNYCIRFYDRQFITRDYSNTGIVEKFDHLLNQYFQSEELQLKGIPTVAFVADKLYFSAKYFGDLVKRETGKTAQEFIQLKLIDLAKEKIFDSSKSVSEVAYELGFKYPQHFIRFFKKQVGKTPNEYRNSA